jgi:hypothetical protein
LERDTRDGGGGSPGVRRRSMEVMGQLDEDMIA